MIWYRGIVNQEGKIVQEGKLITLVESRAVGRNREADTEEAVAAVES